MREYGKSVWNTDIVNRGGQDDVVNFLECSKKYKGDIITNPPYKYCTQFILKALDLVEDGHKVAMFLKLTTLESQERYEKIFSHFPPKYIYVYVKRIACYKNGNQSNSQSAVAYAWFVWVKGSKTEPIVRWLK